MAFNERQGIATEFGLDRNSKRVRSSRMGLLGQFTKICDCELDTLISRPRYRAVIPVKLILYS